MGEAAERIEDLDPGELMHEKEVYEKYGKLFAERELLEARKSGAIEFYDLRKGPHYDRQQIAAYLRSKVKSTCTPFENAPLDIDAGDAESGKPPASSKSGTSGSDTKPAAPTPTIIGMTKALEERAARLLEY